MAEIDVGIIETISPQGGIVYAVIRRKGDAIPDIEGTIVYANSHIFCINYAHSFIPDANKVLSETLIPLNITQSIGIIKLESLIGKEVLITIENGEIKYADTIDTNSYARKIPSKDVAIARGLSSNVSQIDSYGIEYLKLQGYSKNEILLTLSESLGNNKLNGQVIRYGDASVYDAVSKSEVSSRINMESSTSIATNIPATSLKNKTCHIHIKAFSAK